MSDENNTIQKTAEEVAFEKMTAAFNEIENQRNDLATAILAAAKSTKLNANEDGPRMTEVKLALFKTADDILKSQESLHVARSKMALTQKSEQSNESVKQLAIEILRNTDLRNKPTSPVTKMSTAEEEILKQAFETALKDNPDAVIKEEELVIDQK